MPVARKGHREVAERDRAATLIFPEAPAHWPTLMIRMGRTTWEVAVVEMRRAAAAAGLGNHQMPLVEPGQPLEAVVVAAA